MKKLTSLILVNLFLASMGCCLGQKRLPPSRLSVGDRYPDLPFNRVINYHLDKTSTKEFMGKPFILDFWAPWCVPCVDAFPKIDSLQQKYKGRLSILPITTQDEANASRLILNLKKNKGTPIFATVVDDTLHTKLSGHRVVPHYVWVGADGIVKAITDSKELTWQNVERFVNSEPINLTTKSDINTKWDWVSPMFLDEFTLKKNELLYHSVILKFRQGLTNGSFSNGNKITCPNHSISMLFRLGFGEFLLEYVNPNRVILEGFKSSDDTLEIGYLTDKNKKAWKQIKQNHVYSYEVVVDSSFTRKEKFAIMQHDLNLYFGKRGITGRMEKRKQKGIALVRTSNIDKIGTKGGEPKDKYTPYSIDIRNHSMLRFISKFQAFFYKRGGLPIVDETDYSKKIDISIDGDLTNLETINKELKVYDLQFMEKEIEMNMIIITMNRK